MSSTSNPDIPLPAFPEFLAALPRAETAQTSGVYFLPDAQAADAIEAGALSMPETEADDSVTALVRQVLKRHGRQNAQTFPLPALWLQSAMPLDALENQLDAFGVPAHVEMGQSLEDLALLLEAGASVILLANMGELCEDAGQVETGEANGLALAIAVGRDAQTDRIVACRVIAGGQEIEVPHARLFRAWLALGGWMLVTDAIMRG